jgi:Mitochondrial glycoprotein
VVSTSDLRYFSLDIHPSPCSPSCLTVLVVHFQFDHLDVAVQELFEQYLEERGVNSALALFIPEYAEMKEQKV